MIVAITGTGVAFTRLVEALARFANSNPNETIWVQAGPAALPASLSGGGYFSRREILEQLRKCDIVVCHGGSGTICDALAAGHTPIVVPRRHHLGEHVNDHQLEIVEALGRMGRVVGVHDVAKLSDAILAARRTRQRGNVVQELPPIVSTLREVASTVTPGTARQRNVWRLMRNLTRWVPVQAVERSET